MHRHMGKESDSKREKKVANTYTGLFSPTPQGNTFCKDFGVCMRVHVCPRSAQGDQKRSPGNEILRELLHVVQSGSSQEHQVLLVTEPYCQFQKRIF